MHGARADPQQVANTLKDIYVAWDTAVAPASECPLPPWVPQFLLEDPQNSSTLQKLVNP